MNRWIRIIYVDLVEIHTAMRDTHIHVSGCAGQNGLLGMLTTNSNVFVFVDHLYRILLEVVIILCFFNSKDNDHTANSTVNLIL